MNEHERQRAKDIFNAARSLATTERTAYLDETCGGDSALRGEVEQLLADYEAAGSFLDSPTMPLDQGKGDGDATSNTEPRGDSREFPGAIIDRYKILQLIGEGGFGRVYMAEQTEPVVRRVALKVIKLGMDTRQVIARFEAERQALAMMDHANIAKVLDAGATSEGRPYFVMELVKGDPITEYCDRNNLSIPERLDLFAQVCRAVQHAHQKGIIHRDIKPSNVMITMADGKPVPKVIDFGIAKATNARLTEKTLFTEFRQLIGTPQYMSPEQAEASGVDIDTRSDIYSLGVLLYELLTGTTPFDSRRLRAAAFGEIQRIIREEEPPKPSTRLSTLETLPSVAAHRHTEPKRLSAIIRGDLDWIVMKCLEKDRTRRYETADALALEVQRYLNDEPVIAGPPSRAYRVRKFVRRHKVGVAASVAIALALVLGVIGTTGGMAWALNERAEAMEAKQAEAEQRQIAEENERRAIEEAERAEREAERALAAETAERERADELEKVADFQASQLSEIDVPMMGVRLRRDLIEKRRAALERSGRDEDEIGRGLEELERSLAGINFTDVALGTLDENIFERALAAIDEQFADQPLLKARLLQTVADAMHDLGLLDRATHPQAEALEIRRQILGYEHPHTFTSLVNMGLLTQRRGMYDDAESYYLQAMEIGGRVHDEEHVKRRALIHNLGTLMRQMGRYEEAERYLRQAVARGLQIDAEGPDTLQSMNSLAVLLREQDKIAEAEQYYERVLDTRRRVLGEHHPDTLLTIHNMCFHLMRQGDYERAEQNCREALEGMRRVLGDQHPMTLNSVHMNGLLHAEQGSFDDAERFYHEALALRRLTLGDAHVNTSTSLNNIGLLLAQQGRYLEAEPYLVEALEIRHHTLSPDHPLTIQSTNNLAVLMRKVGNYEVAERLSREAAEKSRASLPPGHRDAAMYLATHGQALAALERFPEAEECYLEAYQALKSAPGPPSPLIRLIDALIDLYGAWHSVDPGRGYDERAEEWRRRLADGDEEKSPVSEDS